MLMLMPMLLHTLYIHMLLVLLMLVLLMLVLLLLAGRLQGVGRRRHCDFGKMAEFPNLRATQCDLVQVLWARPRPLL